MPHLLDWDEVPVRSGLVLTTTCIQHLVKGTDLSDENLAILRDTYDIVLVYIAGCGDCKSFLTQYHEVITIQEVWDRFDAVGMAGKPRILVMDLFSIRSTLMANFLEDEPPAKRVRP